MVFAIFDLLLDLQPVAIPPFVLMFDNIFLLYI